MMIIIFSDTHGDEDAYKTMKSQISHFDHIYCLGDSGFSESFMLNEDIKSVRGNYPFAPKYPMNIIEKWHQKTFFMTHGHKYRVKFGLSRIRQAADVLRVDICMFGHTHLPYLEKKGDLLLMNPGALSYQRSRDYPSYAKIDIDEKRLSVQIINLINQAVVSQYNEDLYE